MTAIETRFIGPTNHHGPRYKATATGSHMAGLPPITLTLDSDQRLDSDGNHRRVAAALIRKQGWTPPEYATWYGASTDRGCVWVCTVEHARLELSEPDKVICRQTSCTRCGQDIENMAPAGTRFPARQWRDRGNDTHCNDGRLHTPPAEDRIAKR